MPRINQDINKMSDEELIALMQDMEAEHAGGGSGSGVANAAAAFVNAQASGTNYQQARKKRRKVRGKLFDNVQDGLGMALAVVVCGVLWIITANWNLFFVERLGADTSRLVLGGWFDLRWLLFLPAVSFIQWRWFPVLLVRPKKGQALPFARNPDVLPWQGWAWGVVMIISIGSTFGGAQDFWSGRAVPLFGEHALPTSGGVIDTLAVISAAVCDFAPERLGIPALIGLLGLVGFDLE